MPSLDPESFRRLLVERREALAQVAESGAEAAARVELDQSRVGRLSRMDAMQAQAMAREQDRRRGVERQRIAAALERIDEGEYGYCLRCGEDIAPARLEADPAATLCLGCAAAAERAQS